MDEIISILNKCSFKGKYVTAIKQANLWYLIEDSVAHMEVSDAEKVYLYFNPLTEITCSAGNKRKFKVSEPDTVCIVKTNNVIFVIQRKNKQSSAAYLKNMEWTM